LFGIARLAAGGSGLNVLVVANQNSSNSLQLANYYCERRHVPPQNYLRIDWPGANVIWSNSDFNSVLLNPLLDTIARRGLTNQLDYVLLSMDIPYRLYQLGDAQSSGMNSTTAALFYGFKSDYATPSYDPASCNLPDASSNSYAGSEGVFRFALPSTAATNSFLAMMLTSSNLLQAEAIVDQGVASDGTFPNLPVILAKSSDVFRNIRYQTFDNAIFNTRLRGDYSMYRTNADWPYGYQGLLGFQIGVQLFSIQPSTFGPGAIADSLTSYGGWILEPVDHTTLLAFLTAGASGSYGTIVEPCAYLEKFPSPQVYFYQARGFSLAECYYQSITNPYQGLLVGEPLAAPFARTGTGSWVNLPANTVLSGTTNLSLRFSAADAAHPVQQVDLFIDGKWAQTVTNIPPTPGNILHLNVTGHPSDYTVPLGASVQSVAAGLTALLNSSSNLTQVRAFAHGDRIELQSSDLTTPGAQIPISVSSSPGPAAASSTWVSPSGTNMLDSVAKGIWIDYVITNIPQVGDYLQLVALKTNGQTVAVSVTNTVSGTTLSQFAKTFFAAINTNLALMSPDGIEIDNVIMHEDWVSYGFYPTDDHSGEFNVQARSFGWPAAQVRVSVHGSPTFTVTPAGTNRLDQNLADLQPRAHLYVTAGATNLPVTFALDMTALADGYHELTAVAYEGSHVRTQTRATQLVQVRNHSLAAVFSTLVGGSNTAVEATLQFAVTANANNISRIELFSTGGSLGAVLNLSNASFSVAGSYLGIGLHSFYALVTATDGSQYRTETKWLRLVGNDSPFAVSISAPPPRLVWPAAAGRSYDVLSATAPDAAFQLRTTVTPTNSSAQWSDTNSPGPQRFYRVRPTP
jgi:uncharacterized protein (TIGR03790 family)